MSSLIDGILALPYPLLERWGYAVIFLSSLLESMPMVGTAVPGQTIVILGGWFAQMDVFSIGIVMAVATIGAIAGDGIGYWIGKRYGERFILRFGKFFFFRQSAVEKTKALMRAHAGKALVLGRFNAITRAFGPFAAGLTGVRAGRFFLYNVIGGASWASASVLAGYVFGSSYKIAERYFGRFVFISILLGSCIAVAYRYANKRWHAFMRKHAYAVALAVFSLYLFGKMLEDVTRGDSIVLFDRFVNSHAALYWQPSMVAIMRAVTNIMHPVSAAMLTIIVLVSFIYRKRWYHGLLLLFGMGGGFAAEVIIKHLVSRPRPPLSLVAESSYSFPSGHATMAAIFFAMMLYSFGYEIKVKWKRRLFAAAMVGLFLLIGASRAYLGAHWFSDVIAGFALGLFWLSLLILTFRLAISLRGPFFNGLKRRLSLLW